jgi:hypothetical protein
VKQWQRKRRKRFVKQCMTKKEEFVNRAGKRRKSFVKQCTTKEEAFVNRAGKRRKSFVKKGLGEEGEIRERVAGEEEEEFRETGQGRGGK